MQALFIKHPDDWHVHFRDGIVLKDTVLASSKHFARALVMPNLKPALNSFSLLKDYYERILKTIPAGKNFQPFMTFYLNEKLNLDELAEAKHYSYILGAKLYPAGATTNSSEGAKSLKALYPHFELMQESDLVLQIHGELNSGDIFEREALFIKEQLQPILKNFPRLRIVLEHISTKAAVEFVKASSKYLSATITPHHLLYNRNQLLANGIKPHYYCLPILKHASDQKALQEAATSGNPKFFAGTDSAPHDISQKESACGCAGIYSAPFAVEFYAQAFDNLDKLPMLSNFLSGFGADFYQLSRSTGELSLRKSEQVIPKKLALGEGEVVPLAAGETLPWSVYES